MLPITLIKIGGSLITDKNKPFTVREDALATIAQEVQKAMATGKPLILGHGAGSFGHIPAKKYQTHKGLLNEQSREGIVQVAAAARQLNAIVMEALLKAGVQAVAVSPLSMMTAANFNLGHIFTDSVEQLLKLGLLPVVHGDQVLDSEVGCTIFSTEKVLAHLGLTLKEKKYAIERVIHCGQTNGVYDLNGKTIPLINTSNFAQFAEALGGSGGVDVTGGMLHKVEETLALAQEGIPGLIIDGIEHGSLSHAILGEDVVGTRIEK
jgi:isopentenyl phosphate kinase